MRLKKWINHLFERFGEKPTFEFARSIIKCPCHFLQKLCKECEYAENMYLNMYDHNSACPASRQWYREMIFKRKLRKLNKLNKLKNKINKMKRR